MRHFFLYFPILFFRRVFGSIFHSTPDFFSKLIGFGFRATEVFLGNVDEIVVHALTNPTMRFLPVGESPYKTVRA